MSMATSSMRISSPPRADLTRKRHRQQPTAAQHAPTAGRDTSAAEVSSGQVADLEPARFVRPLDVPRSQRPWCRSTTRSVIASVPTVRGEILHTICTRPASRLHARELRSCERFYRENPWRGPVAACLLRCPTRVVLALELAAGGPWRDCAAVNVRRGDGHAAVSAGAGYGSARPG